MLRLLSASVCTATVQEGAKRSPDILTNKLDVMIGWGGQWRLLLSLEAFSWVEAGGSTEAEESTIMWSEDSWVKKLSLLNWINHQWKEEGASHNAVPHPKGGHPTSPDDQEDPHSFNNTNYPRYPLRPELCKQQSAYNSISLLEKC